MWLRQYWWGYPRKTILDCSKFLACVWKFLALAWNFVIIHEDYHLSIKWHRNFHIAKHFWCVSGNIQHVYGNSDCIYRFCYFSPMTQKFHDWFPAWVRKFMVCVKFFPDWSTFLKSVRKFPACVRKLWSYKNIILVVYHMIKEISRLPKVSGMCP